ncbi:MAG: aromatic amino acid lyase, partial [Duodenibacillus sp.]
VTHIGLALMGEWDVMYKNKRRPASEVRKELKLKPFHPFGMDGISILSNSNVAEAQAIDAVKNAEQVLRTSSVLIASSLEALNGNVSPFLWHTVETKGWPSGHDAAESILLSLKGSYLWQKDSKRYLQDPLSFRSAGYILATAVNELKQTKELLNSAINHTTDNPIVHTEGKSNLWYSQLPAVKMLEFGGKGHYVNSCANFDNTQLAVQIESLSRALGQVMHTSAWRTTQLDDGHRTQLPTYLVAPENKGGDGFANIAQSMSGIYAEGMALTSSVMGYGIPTSIGIEETFNNVPVAAIRLNQLADRTREIFAYELMHTAQAMDMRVRMEKRELGEGTKAMLASYRKVVPYVDKDRAYTHDLINTVNWLKGFNPKNVKY